MAIRRVRIENFKRFRTLDLELRDGMNILVGDNDTGKSTVLEAVHLAITGLMNGRYLRNELSQHLFNNEAVSEYLRSLKKPPALPPPRILIEIFLREGEFPAFEGDRNSTREPACGFYLEVCFDESYQEEYEELVTRGGVLSLPIEYYTIRWSSFARTPLTTRSIPLKSALVDSTAVRHQSGADVYVSRIIRDFLDLQDVLGIAQAYRRMKEQFRIDPSITSVNEKIRQSARVSNRAVSLSAELPSKVDWEDSLVACLDDVPFQYIGKGEQSIIKTKLALRRKEAQDAAVILLEEPENHLTHANLNKLLADIRAANLTKQIVVSTHSSFVANKLGLDRLILLSESGTIRLDTLDPETREFFEKAAGYDTLRLILSKRAILVEGPSDELVVQKAYIQQHGRLPIEDGVDVISVGTSFLRFLEIAERLGKPVAVVTDNDGNPEKIGTKYAQYLGENAKPHIKICYDPEVDCGPLVVDGKPFNYNTLEPKLVKANGLRAMNKILGTAFPKVEDLLIYMRNNKTECALKIFKTEHHVKFPAYITAAFSTP